MIHRVIFRNEMLLARRTLVTASIGVAALIGAFAGFSGLIVDSPMSDMIAQLMGLIPPAMLDAFNFNIASLRSFEGWMASEPYTIFTLIMGLLAANGATATVARELDQGTAESVVALPVSRSTLFLSKVACHVVVVTTVFTLATAAAFVVGALSVGVGEPYAVAALFSAGYFTSLAFAGVGYAASTLVESERTAGALSGAIVVGSFVLHVLATMSPRLAWIGHGSLFRLFDAQAVVADAAVPLLPASAALGLFIAGVAVGVRGFQRKDIT